MSADRFHRPRQMPSPGGTSGRILTIAAAIMRGCDRGEQTLDDALDRAPEELRRTLNHLLMNLFRYRGVLQEHLRRFISKPPSPEVNSLLLVCYTQCRFQSAVNAASAVNVAVTEAKKFHAGNFVNAVMRKVLAAELPLSSAPETVLPPAVFRQWRKHFPAETVQHLTGLFLQEAEFSFRLLPGRELPPEAAACTTFAPFRFGTAEPAAILNSDVFAQGGYYIQDPATAFAPSLVAPYAAGLRRVLDICSAPGGKTLMLRELLKDEAELTAFDISAARQERTRENFARRNLSCRIIAGDPEQLRGKFDLVMADLPCSNSGVFRRRPDALWRFSTAALRDIGKVQQEILARAMDLTAPGGLLLISTCSIDPVENERLTAAPAAAGFKVLTAKTIMPAVEHDGAFAALCIR